MTRRNCRLPISSAIHAAFPEVELELRTTTWREGVHQSGGTVSPV